MDLTVSGSAAPPAQAAIDAGTLGVSTPVPMPGVPAPTWSPAPAAANAAVARRSGRSRAVDILFTCSMLVAVGGVAFAVGRVTAPTTTAGVGAGAGLPGGAAGFGARTGTGTTGTGTGTTGQPGPGGQNAAVVPVASGSPGSTDQQQPASALPADPRSGAIAPGGPQAGFGRVGLTGTVAAIGDGTLSFTTATGETVDVATTDATTYHRQLAAVAADIAVGSFVRITTAGGPGGGFGGARPGGPVASAVPGAASTAASASDVTILLAPPEQTAGGRRGGGSSGTVSAVGDGTISITTADGQTSEFATTDTTTYHRQSAAAPADVVIGSSIRITAAGFGGGFGAGQPGGPSASAAPGAGMGAMAMSAADVEILLPTGP